jgi:dihydrofolate synthase/folylpolyglutamate synthase
MNYKEAIDWLYSFEKFGIKLGLNRITYICKKLGDPQKNYKVIHVGGTNGKGSVCRFLQSILTLNGYKVGVYLSPHLQRFSERFIIDKSEISNKDVVTLIEKIKPIIEEMIKNDNTPTFFEIVTAMAFKYFKDEKVDYAIIEVGLGGRYDATNIVDPIATIITNVSLEHQNILGKTIEEIAYQKAGIIKEGVPLITAAKSKALEEINKVTDEKKSSIIVIDNSFWKKICGGVDWQEFQIKGLLKDYNVKTLLGGIFQGENIAVTIAAIETLQMNGVYITDNSIIEGTEKTINPGRMEIAGFEPLILLDGAHNIDGISFLKTTIEKDFVYKKLILVIGILSDKNILEMLNIITPIADSIIVTKSHSNRACSPAKLKEMIGKKEVIVKDEISNAIDYAKKIAKKNDLICITGSLFTVGEARDYLFKNLQKC